MTEAKEKEAVAIFYLDLGRQVQSAGPRDSSLVNA